MRTLAALALLLAGCYTPELAPCTVHCSIGDPCPNDMTCGNDSFCHASDDSSVCSDQTFKLTVTKSGNGGGIVTDGHALQCGAQCTAALPAGTSVTLMASPQGGSRLSAWSGAGCTGLDACTFKLTADTSVTATFNLAVTLDLMFTGTGGGRVTSTPAGVDCTADCTSLLDLGSSVTLDPMPDNQSVFSGFAGDCTGPTCTLTLDQPATVVVQFD